MKRALDEVHAAAEACRVWGLVRNEVNRDYSRGLFKEHEAKKSGKTLLVTNEGMYRVYGSKKVD